MTERRVGIALASGVSPDGKMLATKTTEMANGNETTIGTDRDKSIVENIVQGRDHVRDRGIAVVSATTRNRKKGNAHDQEIETGVADGMTNQGETETRPTKTS